jgi:hypothetical protein
LCGWMNRSQTRYIYSSLYPEAMTWLGIGRLTRVVMDDEWCWSHVEVQCAGHTTAQGFQQVSSSLVSVPRPRVPERGNHCRIVPHHTDPR